MFTWPKKMVNDKWEYLRAAERHFGLSHVHTCNCHTRRFPPWSRLLNVSHIGYLLEGYGQIKQYHWIIGVGPITEHYVCYMLPTIAWQTALRELISMVVASETMGMGRFIEVLGHDFLPTGYFTGIPIIVVF